MVIGIPREIKEGETRVGATAYAVTALVDNGHQVLVEEGAGCQSAISDDDYRRAGARVVASAKDAWREAQLVVKVKEPQPSEYVYFRPDLVLFTFFHFAALPEMTARLAESGVCAVAYELVEEHGHFVILEPMSEIAGRLSAQTGARYLEHGQGGRGILLSGSSGVAPARAVVIGAGTVGFNAARVLAGMGADVTLMDINARKLRELDQAQSFPCRLRFAEPAAVSEETARADLVVGAVLSPGAAAPKVVSEEDVKRMKPGAVFVDVAIDQGGCAETSRPTSSRDPVFLAHGVIHYCVPNIPAAVPLTSTPALNYASLPYMLALAGGTADPRAAVRHGLEAATAIRDGKILRPEITR